MAKVWHRAHDHLAVFLQQSMQQYSLQPEKSWEIRQATQIDSSRSREYSASITTCQDFFAAPGTVWNALMFYEEIAEDRPFLLRRFLPTPIGSHLRDCPTKSRLARHQAARRRLHVARTVRGLHRVALASHYANLNCLRWVFGRLEAAVCHSFHRYILSAMRSNL